MPNLIGMKRPNTIEELHRYCDRLEESNAEMVQKVARMEEQIRLLIKGRFGPSSEKLQIHPDQMKLAFNEAEAEADPNPEDHPGELETIQYERTKPRRRREHTLDDLEVDEQIEHTVPDDQTCEVCDGPLHVMSTETRRELRVIPAEVKVVEHVRQVCGCRECERKREHTPIVRAPMPAPPIPNSFASPSALAYVIDQKYGQGLPLYRQEKQFERQNVSLSRQTMANWILYVVAHWLTPLYEHLHEHLLGREVLQADETPVQVLHEPGRSAETKSYMWLYRSAARDGPPIALFEYQPTRAGKHPATFLSGFSGYLHADGYQGYESVPGVTLVGCWAHARRKFDEALKALPPAKRSAGPVAAQTGLEFCRRLFAVEKSLKTVTPEQRYRKRLELSVPILDEYEKWLDALSPLPQSALAKAVGYSQRQWKKLTAFLQDGRLEIDNNRSERTLRPFVIGRKNWLFANVQKGATASAVTYSIMETAKENNLKPLPYFTHLFEQLPNIDLSDSDELDALVPWSETLPDACYQRKRAARH